MAETRLRRNVIRHIPTISLNDRPLFMQNGNRRFSAADAQEISNFRRALPQFLAVSVKNILLFVYGMTLGFPTIVIPAIQGGDGREHSDIVLNRDQISWFSSINLICVPMGCVFSGMLTQPIGKKRAMQLVNLPILASWLLFHFSTKTEHLYLALVFSGLGGGLMEAPVLTYVAEITEPKYRGILSALGSTCVITGVFIQFIMGSLMDWRTIAAVSSAFPVVSMIALQFVPESPTWLIRKERFHEAVKALQWLRGWVPEHKIESEFNRLYDELITQPALEEAKAQAEQRTKCAKCMGRFRMFRKRSFLVPFLLVAYTFFTGHFSGKTTLQTYAVQIFHTLKAPINKYHATIILGVAEMIATILCVFLIHFTGKRPLVLISTIGVGVCFGGTAIYAYYLNVVPGFAVNNVVVNASSLVPKESIISQANITNIFAKEENSLRLAADALENDLRAKNKMDTTTFYPVLDDSGEVTTMAYLYANESQPDAVQRLKRDQFSAGDAYKNINSQYENDNLTLLDFTALDYADLNETNGSTTPLIQILDSEEEFDALTTTLPPLQDEKIPPKEAHEPELTEKLPSTKQVTHEILLPVPKQKKNKLAWIPLILLLFAAFFAHFGIRMIPWILIGEVFPAPVRSTASGLVSGLGYIFGFLANKFFLQMLTALTLPGTFFFYSVVALVGAFVLFFTLPETEGRTLAEIEAHFSKKSDMNLFKKTKRTSIQLDNLQNLQMPISPQTEAKIIHLQQSDFVADRKVLASDGRRSMGQTNLGFEEKNTTHL